MIQQFGEIEKMLRRTGISGGRLWRLLLLWFLITPDILTTYAEESDTAATGQLSPIPCGPGGQLQCDPRTQYCELGIERCHSCADLCHPARLRASPELETECKEQCAGYLMFTTTTATPTVKQTALQGYGFGRDQHQTNTGDISGVIEKLPSFGIGIIICLCILIILGVVNMIIMVSCLILKVRKRDVKDVKNKDEEYGPQLDCKKPLLKNDQARNDEEISRNSSSETFEETSFKNQRSKMVIGSSEPPPQYNFEDGQTADSSLDLAAANSTNVTEPKTA
ncbi:uncharacterized protein LOC106161791 [Lingula anatina]|uniref:Uncharacterized protein LOC106161791 n=1 Tax=Lingula anatina TaxID=7574 RepID=A0A1S3I7V0_LINAN|nr:uncharacterized protein LOC106161791 [Lingula anatina]|eukprot:XP_013394273.1 uncharacterized protein LOC106161791 [Lingula anatina]